MRAVDLVRVAAKGLLERRLRAALTILGIVIGSAMVVALMSSSEGQTQAIQEELGKLGPTTLIVRQRTGSFEDREITAIKAVEGVTAVYETVSGSAQATRAGTSVSVSVLGIDPDVLAGTFPAGVAVADGDIPASTELTRAVLGYGVVWQDDAIAAFASPNDVVQLTAQAPTLQRGERAQPTTRGYTVAGTLGEFGSSAFVNVDDTVFLTPRAAQMLLRTDGYNQLIVIVSDPDLVSAKQAELRTLLGDDVIVISATQIASTISGIFETLGTLFTTIAAISLIVAGIGIANTMFVSVIERTSEIGLMKALGFKARHVLALFLLEAGFTGFIGGIIGSLFGVAISYGIAGLLNPTAGAQPSAGGGSGSAGGPVTNVAPAPGGGGGGFQGGAPGGGGGGFQGGGPGGGGGFGGGGGGGLGAASNLDVDPVFGVGLFALVLAFAVGIALLAGVIPARKAAKLDPVTALKRL